MFELIVLFFRLALRVSMCRVSFLKALHYDVSNMYDLMMFVTNGSAFMN